MISYENPIQAIMSKSYQIWESYQQPQDTPTTAVRCVQCRQSPFLPVHLYPFREVKNGEVTTGYRCHR